MKSYLFHSFVASLLFSTVAGMHAQTPAKVALRVKSYTIRAENDGLDVNPSHKGDGIELYLGYVVSEQDKSIGGTTVMADGLTTEKDKKTPKTFLRSDVLFSDVVVPDNSSVAVHLHLIESDETTEKVVKPAFASAKIPNFGDGARNFTPENIAKLFTDLRKL